MRLHTGFVILFAAALSGCVSMKSSNYDNNVQPSVTVGMNPQLSEIHPHGTVCVEGQAVSFGEAYDQIDLIVLVQNDLIVRLGQKGFNSRRKGMIIHCDYSVIMRLQGNGLISPEALQAALTGGYGSSTSFSLEEGVPERHTSFFDRGIAGEVQHAGYDPSKLPAAYLWAGIADLEVEGDGQTWHTRIIASMPRPPGDQSGTQAVWGAIERQILALFR